MSSLVIKISYDMSGKPPRIKTNCKTEHIGEILGEWLSCQAGAGEDDSKPVRRDVYTITIALDLEDDTFRWKHDTGNKGLATGIVMEVLKRESDWVINQPDIVADETTVAVI